MVSTDGTALGGVTRVVVTLENALRLSGWDVDVLLPGTMDPESLARWADRRHVAPNSVWLAKGRRGRLRGSADLWSQARNSSAKIVLLHHGGSHLPLRDIVTLRLSGKRCVVALHSAVAWEKAGRLRKVATKLAAPMCHKVIPCSPAVLEVVLAAGVNPNRCVTIPGGVDQPVSNIAQDEARRQLSLPVRSPMLLIGTIVRMAPEKSIDLLIGAVRRLVDDGLNVGLVVKGDHGPLRNQLIQLGLDSLAQRFFFLEPEVDNELVYAAMDIFALTSQVEGYPLVLLEAAMRGIPAVATRAGSIDLIIEDGITGLLADVGDVEGMAVALANLVNDSALRRKMAVATHERARREFGTQRMVTKYLALLAPLPGSS